MSLLPIDPLGQPAPGYDESQRGQPNGFIGDPDVMDTWATSSLTPQIESLWAEDDARHDKVFPFDLRPQSHEIIRTWAFYTIAKAWYHNQSVPWYHVIISGWILDPDRKKMSKSQGNVVTPGHLLDQYSADAVRYWTARARLGVDTAYDESVFSNGRRLTTKLFNAAKFVLGTFKDVDPATLSNADITDPLDLSFLAQQRDVVLKASEAFEQFEFANALQAIEEFFWAGLCDNYLEVVKRRAYDTERSAGRLSALATLKLLLSLTLRLFAPYIPFLTEEIWSWCFAALPGHTPSVHVAPWPSDADFVGLQLTPGAGFDAAVEVIKAVRKVKGDQRVSMKTPVSQLKVVARADVFDILTAAEEDLKAVCVASTLILESLPAGVTHPDGALVSAEALLDLSPAGTNSQA